MTCDCADFTGAADSAFCTTCGHPGDSHARQPAAGEPVSQRGCEDCDCPVFLGGGGAGFCARCGHGRDRHQAAATATAYSTRAASDENRSGSGLIAGGWLTIGVAFAVALLWAAKIAPGLTTHINGHRDNLATVDMTTQVLDQDALTGHFNWLVFLLIFGLGSVAGTSLLAAGHVVRAISAAVQPASPPATNGERRPVG